jgi:adenylate cyclase
MTRDQRRFAAIVSIDVVSYSRLIGRDEPGTLAQLKALRQEVTDPRIAEYSGRIVNTAGDNQLLGFSERGRRRARLGGYAASRVKIG